jgi:hypothetical protein
MQHWGARIKIRENYRHTTPKVNALKAKTMWLNILCHYKLLIRKVIAMITQKQHTPSFLSSFPLPLLYIYSFPPPLVPALFSHVNHPTVTIQGC